MILSFAMVAGLGNVAKGQLLCDPTCGCPIAPCTLYVINNLSGCDNIPVLGYHGPSPYTPPTDPCDTETGYIKIVWSSNAPCHLSDGTDHGNASISYIGAQPCPNNICLDGFAWSGGSVDLATGTITGSNQIPCPCCSPGGTVTITPSWTTNCFISSFCDPMCTCPPAPAYNYYTFTITCP